jgi:ribonuclease Z
MSFDVTILGSSSATPIYQRHPTAQVLRVHERFFLVDCGEGTLIQLNRYRIRFHKINHIFISHLHGDHYLGLMGLLSTMHLQGRTTDLHLYAPEPLREIIDLQLRHSDTTLRYTLQFHPIDATRSEVIYSDEQIQVRTIVLQHRIPCTGFLFEEQPRPRRIDKEKVVGYDLPLETYQSLKAGEDLLLPDGRRIPNEEITFASPPPRRYAFCSDTIYDERLVDIVKGVDLLYHESTFLHDLEERARETFHSTARQAATIASMAKVKRLIIGHFSARYKSLYPMLDEAKEVFDNTTLALEGDCFSIPLEAVGS